MNEWLRFSFITRVLLVLVLSDKVLATASEGQTEASPESQTIDMQPWRPDNEAGHFSYKLPNSLIDQHASPDRQYVAQLMYAKPGPVYYLTIIDRTLGHRYYLDKRLIIGEAYPFQKMRVYWKNGDTIVIRARHADGSHFLFIHYNRQTGRLTQGKQIIPPPPDERDKLAPKDLKPIMLTTLDDRMLLHRQVPIGVTYDALKQALPQLGMNKADAGGGLTEAFLSIEVLGRKAEVEFNFNNNVLYNFYYHFELDDAEQAGTAYKELQGYYSRHYGAFKEEKVRESEHYAVESSHWDTREVEVSVVNNITPGSHSITWALQQ